MTKYSYGWRPDRPDQRDMLFAPRPAEERPAIPPSVDLRPKMPRVYDQGNIGSCTANAIAAAIDFERQRQHKPFMTPSRLFIYYNERAIEGTVSSDAGADLRDGFKTIAAQGVCPEEEWPYVPSMFRVMPPRRSYVTAQTHRTLKYLSVAQQQADMLDCLAQGYPFCFGITAYESIESEQVAKTGNVPMPAMAEAQIGGHALLAVGYMLGIRTPHLVIFRNSWAESWGDKGYGTIPLEYLTNPNLASDFWTIRLEE